MDVSEYYGFAAALGRESGAVGARAAAAVRKTAAAIERDAKILAPVDTGNLRSSIGYEVTGDGRNTHMTAVIGPTASYAPFVELGTSRMGARPFLFPATDRHLPGFVAAMEQIISNDL